MTINPKHLRDLRAAANHIATRDIVDDELDTDDLIKLHSAAGPVFAALPELLDVYEAACALCLAHEADDRYPTLIPYFNRLAAAIDRSNP